MKDVIIVGAGPAGLSAAIYVQRSGKSALVLEATTYGGQIINTPDIANYPGLAHVSGVEFATNLYNQAKDLGAEIIFQRVTGVEDKGDVKIVKTPKAEYEARAVILATGAKNRPLGVTTLSDIDLKVMPGTYLRLLDGLVRGESVPFEGDALEGLQVMGTLETRALDFRNVVIMSANEELFPHRSADNSFIPPELRKGFGLPTLEYQDAVWAYYFYRLIQRAENVWLIYDSRTEGLLSGEESRYVKQLEYHFHFPLKRFTAVAPVSPLAEEEFIPKTQEDIDAVRRGHLSASSLQSYLYCQTKFYYQAVKGLKAEDEVTESLDASMIGTIFHGVMEQLYSGTDTVTAQMLDTLLQGGEDQIRAMIRQGICEKMRSDDVEGRNLVIEEVILEYVKGTLRHDLRLLRESGSQGFRILGLERYMRTTIDGFPFIGFVDRIDTYKPGELRIVDYKTGHVEDDDILITDANAQAVVDKLFGESNTGRPKIALQLFLYGLFAHEGLVRDAETVVNSIYSTSKILTSPLPDVPESPVFSSLMKERLHGLLTEIADTSRPFRRTQDRHTCALCDFRSICGR